jgi:hypothetical protein
VNDAGTSPPVEIALHQTFITMQIISKNVPKTLFAAITYMLLLTKICTAQNTPANPVSKLALPAETFTVPFTWLGDSTHSRWDPHAALLVPVRLAGCSQRFYMQFDLGSPFSMFYGPAMNAVRTKYPQSVPAEEDQSRFTNYHFAIGNLPVLADEIVLKAFGKGTINWQDTAAVNIIGTIGTDFIDNRFIVIDYPNRIITTGSDITPALSQGFVLTDFIYAGGRILLPATIRDKKQLFYFDTGSSAFGLMTDKITSEWLASPGSIPVSFSVNSWGKQLSAYTLPANDSVLIASQKLPLRETTYVEGVNESMVAQMKKTGISGLTGNKLFVNNVLLIDVRHRKFGVR